MVCLRCKLMVKEELRKLGLHFIVVDLGEVEIMETLTMAEKEVLKHALQLIGLKLMDDKKAVLIQKIKDIIIAMVYCSDEMPTMNFSELLSKKIHADYTHLANLFSEVQGTTIEQFIIAHKIERIKDLLLGDNLNLTEISFKMNYSSVAHLSNQFKKMTGLTPSHFKQLRVEKRLTKEGIH